MEVYINNNIIKLKEVFLVTFKELLQQKNMSGYELAKTSAASQAGISAWVAGTRNPLKMNLEMAHSVSHALEMTLDGFYAALKEEN